MASVDGDVLWRDERTGLIHIGPNDQGWDAYTRCSGPTSVVVLRTRWLLLHGSWHTFPTCLWCIAAPDDVP